MHLINSIEVDLILKQSSQKNKVVTGKTPFFVTALQTHHVYFTLKRRGNGRFHVVSTWNTRSVFVLKYFAFTLSTLN